MTLSAANLAQEVANSCRNVADYARLEGSALAYTCLLVAADLADAAEHTLKQGKGVHWHMVEKAFDAANAWRKLKMDIARGLPEPKTKPPPPPVPVQVKRLPVGCIPPVGVGCTPPPPPVLKAPPTWPFLPPPGVVVSEGALGRGASQVPKPVTWKAPPPELQKPSPSCKSVTWLAARPSKAPPPPPPPGPSPPPVPPPPPGPPPDGPGPNATFEGLPPTLVAATLLKGCREEATAAARPEENVEPRGFAGAAEVFFVGDDDDVAKENVEVDDWLFQ